MLFAGICLASCSSITPIPHERETISFDGNDENSGIIGFLPNGSLEVTRNKRDYFVSLVRKLGSEIQPPVSKDYDLKEISTGSYEMTGQDAETLKKLMLAEDRIKP